MIETTSHPAIPTDNGLRSAPGIRWLLLAGALVTGVSVYRLLEAQWASIPVPIQFLVLVAGALGIFGLGRVARRRLHLPYAGSALLFLFTGLLPVLAWGAAYLRLLDTVWGWLAFSAGGAVLLGAAVSVMRSELRYPGRLYPAALGILFVAQAALPSLAERWAEGLYVVAAVALGAVLHVGSRHVNRFFFHRDQRDGRDRPVHLVPFLLLGILYVGALTGLDLDSPFLALPVAVLGIVLAGTGEEYYRALFESLGHAPRRWPWRSVALLALGFSLTVAAVPLALMDSSAYCLLLVAAGAAGLFLRWSLRYSHTSVHVLGVLTAFVAWNSVLFIVAPLRIDGSLLGWHGLGFFAVLIGLGVLLRYRQAPERLHRIHGVLMTLQLLGIAALASCNLDATSLPAAAGAAGLLAGYYFRHSATSLVGGLMLSLAAHIELLFRLEGPSVWTALLTQSLFVVSWLAARRLRELRGSLRALAVFHGFLGLFWLAGAGINPTLEPLILLLGGIALLWEGLADRRLEGTRHQGIDLGMTLAVLWLPLQILINVERSWSSLLVTGLTLVGLELGFLVFAARRSAGHWLAKRLGMELEDWNILTALSLRGLVRAWLVLAVAAGLLFAGWEVLVLTLTMTGVLFLTRTGIEDWAPRLAFPARLTLLPLLHFAVLAATTIAGSRPDRDLIPAIFDPGPALIPWIAACGLAWRGLIETLGRRRSLRSWTLGVETVIALGYLLAFLDGSAFAPWMDAALIALAAGWAAVSFLDAKRDRDALYGWQMQAWAGLAVLHAFAAGWLHFGSGVAPYVLLAVGAAQYALGAFYERKDLGASITPSCRFVGLGLPLLAGSLSLTVFPGMGTVWFPVLATFLVSLFYTVVASRETRRVFPAAASVAFLGLALLKAIATAELGAELYCLAPGFGLLLLAWLLRAELGPLWNRRVTAAGASFVYATPIVALSSEISWGWLAALLVLSVAFGSASFALRSRSLLTVSTAALLTDLGFFVFRIGTTAPLVLWVLGLGFGMTLMATAAWLEYRREGVLQQIRVFGRELQSWS